MDSCKGKGNATAFGGRLQAHKGRHTLSLCLLISVPATLTQDVMLTPSLCPAYARKSPSRDPSEGTYWETYITVTPTYVMAVVSVPTLPHPVLNPVLRWEPCEKQHLISNPLICLRTSGLTGGGRKTKHPGFDRFHSPGTSWELPLLGGD